MPTHGPLIEKYLEGPSLLRRAVSGLDHNALTARPIPGKWSILEVVCHLVDSEQAYCHRMKRVIAEDDPLLPGYDETRFAATLGYHSRDLNRELLLLEEMRIQIAQLLSTLDDSVWKRTGTHTQYGPKSLRDLVQIEADHVPHHLPFIEEKRKALGL